MRSSLQLRAVRGTVSRRLSGRPPRAAAAAAPPLGSFSFCVEPGSSASPSPLLLESGMRWRPYRHTAVSPSPQITWLAATVGAAAAAWSIAHSRDVARAEGTSPPPAAEGPVAPRSAEGSALCAAVREGDAAEVRAMLLDLDARRQKGAAGIADVPADTRHVHGWAPLHVAAASGNAALVALLLEAGASPDAPDAFALATDGDRPRGGGAFFGDDVFRDFFGAADPFAAGRRGPPREATDLGALRRKQRDRYAEFSGLNPRASTVGFTPLHYAAARGSVEAARLLLEHPPHGADPTLRDRNGFTAADYCESDPIKKLIEKKTEGYAERKASTLCPTFPTGSWSFE